MGSCKHKRIPVGVYVHFGVRHHAFVKEIANNHAQRAGDVLLDLSAFLYVVSDVF